LTAAFTWGSGVAPPGAPKGPAKGGPGAQLAPVLVGENQDAGILPARRRCARISAGGNICVHGYQPTAPSAPVASRAALQGSPCPGRRPHPPQDRRTLRCGGQAYRDVAVRSSGWDPCCSLLEYPPNDPARGVAEDRVETNTPEKPEAPGGGQTSGAFRFASTLIERGYGMQLTMLCSRGTRPGRPMPRVSYTHLPADRLLQAGAACRSRGVLRHLPSCALGLFTSFRVTRSTPSDPATSAAAEGGLAGTHP
jgi:hypothetical protein